MERGNAAVCARKRAFVRPDCARCVGFALLNGHANVELCELSKSTNGVFAVIGIPGT